YTGNAVITAPANAGEPATWALPDIEPALADDTYTAVAEVIDAAGNISAPTDGLTFTIDTVAPDQVLTFEGFDDVGPVTGVIVNNSTIDDTQPTLRGTVDGAEQVVGSVVKVTVQDQQGNTVFTANVDLVAGANAADPASWSIDVNPELANGTYTATAIVVDPAGNESQAGDDLTFSIDSDAPTAPVIVNVVDDVPFEQNGANENIANGGITNDATPTIEGTAPAGTSLTVYNGDPGNGGVELGTTTVANDGSWSFTPTTDLPEGDYDFYATSTSAAGIVSGISNLYEIEIDLTDPNKPDLLNGTLKAEDDVGPVTGDIADGTTTDDADPRLYGEVNEPNGKVVVIIDGNEVATVDVDENGNWEYNPATLDDGEHKVQI
ncbi:MAG: Ig-like domain-containing protein, partial [Cellvibrionaceae bacterium]|nr:Ig-like domain-containing protein [Cellvibrionaceae bacterium]